MNQNKSNNLLFHYTKVENAISILKSGLLYFCHHKKMNDPTEFFHADRLLIKTAASQAMDEVYRKDGYYRTTLKPLQYNAAKVVDSRSLIESVSKALSDDYYIFSATEHDDRYDSENGSLVMWRGYGNENGCALVFDKSKLIFLLERAYREGRVMGAIDGKVQYLKSEKELEQKFSSDYRKFVDF